MSIPAPGSGRRWSLLVGAALWIGAGFAYLVLEAGAATAFRPDYSYARNYISDLGMTTGGMVAGRTIDSPAAYLMNTAFYLQGVSFLVAATLVVLGLRSARPGWFLGFAAGNAVGNILVATVHGGSASGAGVPTWVHGAGAVLAIVGGNAAVLAGSKLVRASGGAQWYRAVSVWVGALGLLSLAMLRLDSSTTAFDLLPDGVWERVSVYSIIGWQVFTGFCLLAWTLRSGPVAEQS